MYDSSKVDDLPQNCYSGVPPNSPLVPWYRRLEPWMMLLAYPVVAFLWWKILCLLAQSLWRYAEIF